MATRTNDVESDKRKRSLTSYQKGRLWATVALLLTGLFSLFANVRSTELSAEPVAYAVFPVVVLFVLIHLIGHYHPKSVFQKRLVYVGLGLSAVFAFGMSGVHIVEQAAQNGQPWYLALPYPFVVDFPSVIATLVLAKKGASVQNGQKTESTQTTATPTKKTTVAKATSPSKTAVPAKTPAKRTSATKKAVPAVQQVSPVFRNAVIDTEADIEVNLNNAA